MTAKYGWRDETGLQHPSLVVLDITEDRFPPLDQLKDMAPMYVKRIYAAKDYFIKGKINRRKLPRIKGYRFQWHNFQMNNDVYALFLGYEVKNR